MTDSIIPINHIERKPDSEYYRVVGKGVTVEFLLHLINDPEWSVERICENYGLSPAEVHAAWAFYYDHQEEIDRRLEVAAANHKLAAQADEPKRQRVQERYKEKTGHLYPDIE